MLDQYRPLVERVASPDEFADLLREVLGELGTSHAYVTAARRNEGPPHYQRRQGLLGANFVRRDGGWTVKRILPGDSSDSKARSPLAGTGIREGAVLTHVDGRPVDPDAGPYPLLAGAGGTTVELTFTPAEDGEMRSAWARRRVAVVPLVDERPLRYQDWVAKRRAVVRELSGGRCGYLHIPDMGGSGWAQFNRDLRMEVSRPALIVDVRGNAGGHISELVVEKLSRTILGWDLTRDAQPVSYASNAPRGPVVALADEATSSDGDMITAAFKLLKLGPVVGQRTWGGVVGMTGRHQLGDGTVITVPMNAAWFDAYGWSVENQGRRPRPRRPAHPAGLGGGPPRPADRRGGAGPGLLETDPPGDTADLQRRPGPLPAEAAAADLTEDEDARKGLAPREAPLPFTHASSGVEVLVEAVLLLALPLPLTVTLRVLRVLRRAAASPCPRPAGDRGPASARGPGSAFCRAWFCHCSDLSWNWSFIPMWVHSRSGGEGIWASTRFTRVVTPAHVDHLRCVVRWPARRPPRPPRRGPCACPSAGPRTAASRAAPPSR